MKIEFEKDKDQNILFVSDLHCPNHSPEAVKCMLEIVKMSKPDMIIFLGDLVDFAQVSRYEHDPRIDTIQSEIEMAVGILSQFKLAAPDGCKVFFCEGNHDARLSKYVLRNAGGLMGLDCLNLKRLLSLDTLGIRFIPERERFILGDTIVSHGWSACPKSGSNAHKAIAVSASYNYIQGHSHRLAKVFLSTYDMHTKWGVEAGCLCKIDPELFPYNQDRNIDWAQGSAMMRVRWVDGKCFSDADLIRIKDGHAIFDGKLV